MATTEFTGLQLSADDVRQLTGWGDAMVEDYISVVEALNEIQTGGATDNEVLLALKELVDQHIGDDENPHATSLVNLIDTLINEVTLGNDNILIFSNGRWVNRPISDVISSCCKDLIIISSQSHDRILSAKELFTLGLRTSLGGVNTDNVGLSFENLPDEGYSSTLVYDSISRSLGASSFGNICWNATGTRFYQLYGSITNQVGIRYQEFSVPYDLSSWTFTSSTILMPAVSGSTSNFGTWWVSKDEKTLVTQGSDDLYQFDTAVAGDFTVATFTKKVTGFAWSWITPRSNGVTPDNSSFLLWYWSSSINLLYKYTILDDNDAASVSFHSSYDLEPEFPPLDASPRGCVMSPDGTKLWLMEDDISSTRHLKTFSIPTPYDISAITLVNDDDTTFTYDAQSTYITWSLDGTKFYSVGNGSTDTAFQYSSTITGGGLTAKLYHDDVERVKTTSEGIIATGKVVVDGAGAEVVLPNRSTGSEPTSEYEGGLVYNSSVNRPTYRDDVKWNPIATKEEHDALQAEVDPLTAIQDYSIEPTGMYDRAETTTAFVDGTRTFSITRTGTDFTYFIHGVKHTIAADLSFVIPDTEGFYYFYLDDDETIKYLTAFDLSLIADYSWLGNIYWDATNKERVMFADERHGLTMDSSTHAHLHLSIGAQYISGLGLADFTADDSGDLAVHAQFSVSSGLIRDEDIPHLIPAYGLPANIPVIWRTGASGDWRKKAADDYPIIYSGSGGYTGASGLPAYNEWTGTTWQLTEISNGKYMLMHFYATNDIDSHVIAICGQNEYANLNDARDGANIEITNVGTVPYEEWTPVATVIFQCATGYANVPKARIRTTDTGHDWIDWRTAAPEAGAPIGDHGTLGGLGDDDHPQYHNDTRGDVRYYTKTLADSTFEPIDPTILRDADIGVTVQAYSALNAYTTDITYETLDANGDVGTLAGQLAIGNHTHAGVYEPADATILKDADIGVTVQAYDATILVDADIGVNVEAYVAKNTAWNKNFGTGAGEVMEGNTPIASDFTGLSDTPANYTGSAGYQVFVNGAGTGLEFVSPSAGAVWGAITGVLSNQTDLQSALDGKEDSFSKNTAFNKDFGTIAGTVAEGDHNHSGVYEPADATILKDADIGVNVEAYVVKNTAWNKNFGTLAGTVAEGNHNHSGVYEPADATILKDADIGVTVQAYDATILVDADIGITVEGYVAKNTAWNKNFGTGAGEVMEGNTSLVTEFTGLSDTPASYAAAAGYQVFVNGAGNALEFVAPSAGAVWGAITGTLSSQTDLQLALDGKEDTFSKNTAFNKNFGTLAGTVSEGNHNHSGVYEPADATILKDADIGVTVQAYSLLNAYTTDITYGTLDANGDVGTGAGQLAIGNHTHSGVYEPADATILKDADIGVTVQAYNINNALKADVTYGTLNANGDVGTGAGQLAIGDHNHSGVYEPADATILKDADIGVTVQAYNLNNALKSDITYGTLNTNGDVGTGAGQLAIGDHNHTGVYEPADATILKDSDIGVTVEAFAVKNSAWNKNFGTTAGTVMEGDTAIPADFTDLNDTPASYTGQSGKVVVVNVGETGVEFATPSSGSGIWRGATPPSDKTTYPQWFNTDNGLEYTWFEDGTSDQWVQTQITEPSQIGAEVPVGGIIMYNGAFADIPANWALCDGTSGTPNLTDKFVYGTNTELELETTGGSADAINVSHSHTGSFSGNAMASHGHSDTFSVASDSHSHGVAWQQQYGFGTGGQPNPLSQATAYGTKKTTDSDSHSHVLNGSVSGASAGTPSGTVTVDSAGASGTDANIPPYVKLAYIMRIA